MMPVNVEPGFSSSPDQAFLRDADATMAQTLVITCAYNGAPFHGFASQSGLLTVQGELEKALEKLLKREVSLVCAGRTDTGVHARSQVVSLALSPQELAGRHEAVFLRSLNALTHEAISVRKLELKGADFSARFDALSREYRYFLCIDSAPPIFADSFSWHVGPNVDVDAMKMAFHYLVGEHDFKSFCVAASARGRSTVREIFGINMFEENVWGERLLVIQITGNAFLHSMVRTIVGTLLCVGRHQREAQWVLRVRQACDRKLAGQCAPARGLVLWQVNY